MAAAQYSGEGVPGVVVAGAPDVFRVALAGEAADQRQGVGVALLGAVVGDVAADHHQVDALQPAAVVQQLGERGSRRRRRRRRRSGGGCAGQTGAGCACGLRCQVRKPRRATRTGWCRGRSIVVIHLKRQSRPEPMLPALPTNVQGRTSRWSFGLRTLPTAALVGCRDVFRCGKCSQSAEPRAVPPPLMRRRRGSATAGGSCPVRLVRWRKGRRGRPRPGCPVLGCVAGRRLGRRGRWRGWRGGPGRPRAGRGGGGAHGRRRR